jgi:hypothetical protein
VVRDAPGWFKEVNVPQVCKNYKYFSGLLQACYKYAQSKPQAWFKHVSRMLQVCIKCASSCRSFRVLTKALFVMLAQFRLLVTFILNVNSIARLFLLFFLEIYKNVQKLQIGM